MGVGGWSWGFGVVAGADCDDDGREHTNQTRLTWFQVDRVSIERLRCIARYHHTHLIAGRVVDSVAKKEIKIEQNNQLVFYLF